MLINIFLPSYLSYIYYSSALLFSRWYSNLGPVGPRGGCAARKKTTTGSDMKVATLHVQYGMHVQYGAVEKNETMREKFVEGRKRVRVVEGHEERDGTICGGRDTEGV